MRYCICIFASLTVTIASASQDTNGPHGINSTGLVGFDGNPLTGNGVSIGQVELERAGKSIANGGPDDAAHSNTTINPTAVFYQDHVGASTDSISDHAEAIAGIMISTDSARTGVTPQAHLYSGAFLPATNIQDACAVTAQNIAVQNGDDVRAINMSFGDGVSGTGVSNDGNQQFSLFVDWSASQNDVLYIVAGHQNSDSASPDIPKDNFNGMTIATAKKDANGVYDTVGPSNNYTQDADGDRTSISLMAPGDNVQLNTLNNGTTTQDGTSNAAPMVTGTIALLQQYANQRGVAATPNWSPASDLHPDYVRHQVMKAVLMNSADKIHLQSDLPSMIAGHPALTVPTGGFLDQDKTVLRMDGGNWFSDTAAADKSPDTGGLKPLDDQFGAGELDAKRALKQFSAGEFHSFESGGPPFVPVIGWDYGHSQNQNQSNTYAFNQRLPLGSFISITLAFDRVVQFAMGGSGNMFHSGDKFQASTDFQTPGHDQFSDLDLFLIDTTTGVTEAVSRNGESTIEHIFWQIQNDDNYEIQVLQTNTNGGPVDYGVAWWADGSGPIVPGAEGDINQDGHVDAKDISAIEKALTNESAYANSIGMTTDELSLIADVNGDGVFNNADLQALLNFLKDGNGSTSVPEPTSFALLAAGGLLLILRTSRRMPNLIRPAY